VNQTPSGDIPAYLNNELATALQEILCQFPRTQSWLCNKYSFLESKVTKLDWKMGSAKTLKRMSPKYKLT